MTLPQTPPQSGTPVKHQKPLPQSMAISSTLAIFWGLVWLILFGLISLSGMLEGSYEISIYFVGTFLLPGILLIVGGVGIKRLRLASILLTIVVSIAMSIFLISTLEMHLLLAWLGLIINILILCPLVAYIVKRLLTKNAGGV